ncbi:hypothetical protein SAMN05660493_00784 [Epilithonimonas bovis DSM 19482]|uniref:Uncharacterized protein n=1 Tax=Epilithonimonas bovis DSM 19482 TaxID=1121284 RepID=A0A1U7PVX8_9FLAO|nr:hypothetical protein [Epilithonimonas bovis]SIT96112.1 hypothetical protein SAMN05660493_00784 [Epilithonimonas bovis DSM 19482]
MNNILNKLTEQKWMNWAVNNPKRFYIYSMVFLSVSFIGSLIQGIFFPSDNAFKIKPPAFYTKSVVTENGFKNNEKEMEKIVNELKILKTKRDQKTLLKTDSLRIEYLYNQYQQLKNAGSTGGNLPKHQK